MQAIEERFSAAALTGLRRAIDDAGGNEVFLLGSLDDAGVVCALRVLARGNRQAVPALLKIPRPGEVVIHNHPSGVLQPSEPDLAIASKLGEDGVGFYIVDNRGGEVYVVVEPHRAHQAQPLDGRVAELLAPGGEVATRLSGYEHRPQQLHMLTAVAKAFNEDGILTVEAGTGTGKSLAYLLPAIEWAIQNHERVIVSTHTINLQEQLVTKDLPFLIEKAGLACSTALVKGRGNYLCKRKAAQLEQQQQELIEDEIRRELNQILAWAKRTKDGSLSDLAVRPSFEVWEQVISENDNCLRARCPHYDSCFFYSARRAAAKADIVVANHHLLMADLALRQETQGQMQNGVLPPAKRVIIDEAHHLEDVATNYLGVRSSYVAIERLLGRLRSQRAEHKGVLPALMMALDAVANANVRTSCQSAARRIEEFLIPRRVELLADAEQLFQELTIAYLAHSGSQATPEKLRIVPQLRSSPFWRQVDSGVRRMTTALADYADELYDVTERVDSVIDEVDRQILYLNTELRALQGRLARLAAGWLSFVGEDESTCRWIELARSRRGASLITFNSAPIRVGPLLRKALFEEFPTAVMTSATLAVDRRFDFYHQRVGIDGLEERQRIAALQIDSPFDFAQQALLAVPHDMPEPNAPDFESALHDAIHATVTVSGGGTFVLFTAYGLLNRAVSALGNKLRAQGFTLLQQGQANRQLLLQRFVREPKAVLFATDSFWEGVDVRGDALRCVVITRLPFRVPTEPIEQARVEDLQARGGDPFLGHAVPQAVIKLKQGFGRLIRARSDSGAVVLLDSRVVRKAYGRVFLDSLPPARLLIADSARVYRTLGQFFAERGAQRCGGSPA